MKLQQDNLRINKWNKNIKEVLFLNNIDNKIDNNI
jgi:hypothetical protein